MAFRFAGHREPVECSSADSTKILFTMDFVYGRAVALSEIISNGRTINWRIFGRLRIQKSSEAAKFAPAVDRPSSNTPT